MPALVVDEPLVRTRVLPGKNQQLIFLFLCWDGNGPCALLLCCSAGDIQQLRCIVAVGTDANPPPSSVIVTPRLCPCSTALAYGEFVVLWVVFYTGNFVLANAIIYTVLTVMAVWCHLKTMLSEPGVVPREALPLRDESEDGAAAANHTLCGRCESYKPTR